MYIVAQIIGYIAFIISLVSYHKNSKKEILSTQIIANTFNIIHYYLLEGYSGFITKIVAIFRDSFILKKEKNKHLQSPIYLYMLICIYILIAYFTYEGFFSIFSVLAALIYTIPVWNGNKKVIKETALVTYFFWLIYNISILSLSGITSNIVAIISTIIAVIKERKKK